MVKKFTHPPAISWLSPFWSNAQIALISRNPRATQKSLDIFSSTLTSLLTSLKETQTNKQNIKTNLSIVWKSLSFRDGEGIPGSPSLLIPLSRPCPGSCFSFSHQKSSSVSSEISLSREISDVQSGVANTKQL